MMMRFTKEGWVYLIGAGAGSVSLLSWQAERLLNEAEVVIYDALIDPEIVQLIPEQSKRIYVGKRGGKEYIAQERINELLVREAKGGKVVVRLKGGDPLLFGRGAEELEFLKRHGICCVVVPGISSPQVAAAYAGIPLTHRDFSSELHIITGHAAAGKETGVEWEKVAGYGGTLVLLMAVGTLREICQRLMHGGMKEAMPLAVVEQAGNSRQRTLVTTVGSVAKGKGARKVQPPAVIVIGEVVSLREGLDWFERSPLLGRQIGVTWTEGKDESYTRWLAWQGAAAHSHPLLGVEPIKRMREFAQVLQAIEGYDLLLFTSPNGVKVCARLLKDRGKDLRALKGIKLAAIGESTARALEELGLRADFVPARYEQGHLARHLPKRLGKKVLAMRAEGVEDRLTPVLEERGFEVKTLEIYRLKEQREEVSALWEKLRAGQVECVLFASGGAVRALLKGRKREQIQRVLKGKVVGSLGSATTRWLHQFGIRVNVQPRHYTVAALLEKLYLYYEQRRR